MHCTVQKGMYDEIMSDTDSLFVLAKNLANANSHVRDAANKEICLLMGKRLYRTAFTFKTETQFDCRS